MRNCQCFKEFFFIPVQTWLHLADYNRTIEDFDSAYGLRSSQPKIDEITIIRPILWKLAYKIGLATQLSTNKVLSTTPMQVINVS